MITRIVKSPPVAALLGLAGSVPVLTLALLVVIDLGLRQGNPLDSMGYHTVDLWNLPPRFAICKETSPDVALLGSSLLLTLNLNDKESFTFSRLYPPDFQDLLRKQTGRDITCITMCTGAQMVSEAYMIARAILSRPDYPRAIIYGVALRDFMNDGLKDEWTTDSFLSTAPFNPVTGDLLALMSCDQARLEYLASHFWYLYRNRVDFKNVFAAWTKNFLEYFPLDVSFQRTGDDRYYTPRKEGWLWEEWIPRKHIASQFENNPTIMKAFVIAEHLPVYQAGSESARAIEARYFDALVRLCKEKGVHLVVVNMPLSAELMSLAPPGLNDAFRGYLASETERSGVPFIDLLGDPMFPSSDFSDGAHLTYKGSTKLAKRLIDELKEHYPDVLTDIKGHADARAADPKRKEEREGPYNFDIPLS